MEIRLVTLISCQTFPPLFLLCKSHQLQDYARKKIKNWVINRKFKVGVSNYEFTTSEQIPRPMEDHSQEENLSGNEKQPVVPINLNERHRFQHGLG